MIKRVYTRIELKKSLYVNENAMDLKILKLLFI